MAIISMSANEIVLVIIASVFAAIGQFLFKLGATNATIFMDFVNKWIALGLVCYGVGTVIWIYVMSSAKLTEIYPFTALVFCLVYLLGAVVLKEQVNMMAWFGLLFIFLGLGLITKA
jgi:drug/metabolite transporter (DMT)-like permease